MKRRRILLCSTCFLFLASCSLPFLGPDTGPAPIPGTPDYSDLAFATPSAIRTPSPLPTATPTATFTPDTRWMPYPMPSPTHSPYQWTCWEDGSPDPCHRVFQGISLLPGGGEGWIVGERGVILYWAGTSWGRVGSPVDLPLRLVRAVAPGDAWAVGDEVIWVKPDESRRHTVFLRWEGGSWKVFNNPTQFSRVVDWSFVSPEDGWGIATEEDAGNSSTFLIRWNGTAWETFLRAPTLNAIWMIATNDGWAVGNGGAILHWDGTIWSPVESPTEKDLDGLAFSTQDSGWATSSQGVILRYVGGAWMIYSGRAPNPRRMVLDLQGDGWMFGSWNRGEIILRWLGKEWDRYFDSPPDGEVLGLASPSAGKTWAVGWVPGRSRAGMIWNWGSDGWVRAVEHGPLPIRAAAFLADDDAWGVGEDGLIAHWDGSCWEEVRNWTPQTLNAIAFLSPQEGWAAGEGGQILYWNGTSWSAVLDYQVRTSIYHRIDALAFTSSTDGWAAGAVEGGDTLKPWMLHWNGSDWEEMSLFPEDPPCKCSLSALYFRSPDDGWAVGGGEEALIMHWDGTSWTAVLREDGYRLLSITAVAANDLWAVGVQEKAEQPMLPGLALHWNGKKWTPAPLPAGVTWLDSILFSAQSGGWIAGKGLLHWNGTAWGTVYSPVEGVIVTLAQTPSGELWAVTDTGAVLKLNDQG